MCGHLLVPYKFFFLWKFESFPPSFHADIPKNSLSELFENENPQQADKRPQKKKRRKKNYTRSRRVYTYIVWMNMKVCQRVYM